MMIAAQKVSPIILGFDGPVLNLETQAFIRKLNPVGFILFRRNCETADQLRVLCASLKELTPHHEPLIFIDQEGGRVQRLKWQRRFPPAAVFGNIAQKEGLQKALKAVELNYYLIARELQSYGINVNCAPVADIRIEGADEIIGDRAFSSEPEVVAVLNAAAIKGMLAGGVWPIIKHAPGHGRAYADSHKELPIVKEDVATLEKTDFYPFKVNNKAPFVMTAHVAYQALDGATPATQSAPILKGVFKEKMGLEGLIVADDMFMQALDGSLLERSTRSLHAGCDLIICGSGHIDGRFAAQYWPELKTLEGLSLSASAMEKIKNLPKLPRKFLLSAEDATQELDLLLKGYV